jgi:hypothetical protein
MMKTLLEVQATKKLGLLLVFAASLSLAQQSEAPVQLTQVPPKPTCIPYALFSGAACNDLWDTYKQALALRQQQDLQLYVNRQKELASVQASAPLQQQIANLNKLNADQQAQIKSLHEQMQAETVAASQSSVTAHTTGLQQGAGIGAGATLLLFGLIFGIRRLTQSFSVTKKPQARAASA